MPGELQSTPLHRQYRCQNPACAATIDSQMAIYRAFNGGRCHCGGELKAIADQARATKRKQGVM